MSELEFRREVLPLKSVMYGIALRMGIPPDDAADAVQDTLIRLWRSRDSIPDPPDERRLYCMAAFRNICVTMLRRRKITAPLEEAEAVDTSDNREVEYRDTRQRIEILIESLPAGQREVVRMSGIGGFDNSEIARATGFTETNVRQMLSRGRRRLRDLIKNNF